jgi:limonene-1,2-epoxide hydrolase
VGLLIVRLVELLIVIVPVIGVLYGGFKALSKVRERSDDGSTAGAPEQERSNKAAQWQAIKRTVREHDRTDTRWLDYEIDVSKLLDYPLMTDMRDPLTQRFHRAKLHADLLRPADASDLLDDSDAAREYIDAVEEYVTAFDVAEAEAIRKRRSVFSREEQQRLSRAHGAMRIATDTGATPQERERAFDVARRELDGLIVLPERTRAAIERGIAGELDS